MRPNMLWLARVNGGAEGSIPLLRHGATGALEDWLAYSSEMRFRCEAYRP
jgi:hypothetical protein